MKYLLIFLLVISFTACERFSDNAEKIRVAGKPSTSFRHHILEGYFIKSIAFDSKGNAWIGTFRQGLIKFNSSETVVYNSSNSLIPDSLVISDIAVDGKDRIWIGAEGLIEFDGRKFKVHNSENSSIPEDYVHSIAIDSKDNLWFTSCRFRQGGIVKYDGSNWEVFTPENSELPVNLVHSIAVGRNDEVWLALGETTGNSYLTEISDGRWRTYTGEDLGFDPYYLSQIAVNSQNEVCAGIDYSLSSCLYHSGPQVFVFDGNTSIQLMLDSTAGVRALMVDNEDNIWCSTGQGFAVYNWEHWIRNDTIFREYGSFEIVQAPDNAIWIGTGNGIYISD